MDIQEKMYEIGTICDLAQRKLELYGQQHSCIFAAAVLTDVFRHKGYSRVFPLTVKPLIFNPMFHERAKTFGMPTDEATKDKWMADGCRMIGLGVKPELAVEGQWAGHLVVVLPNHFGDRHAVCDITITQATKPEWGIDLMPLSFRAPDAFIKGEKEFKADVKGSLVVYMAFPGDKSYEESPNWTKKDLHKQVSDEIIRELK